MSDDLQFHGTVIQTATRQTWHYQVIALPLSDVFSWDGVARCGEDEQPVKGRTVIVGQVPHRSELERRVAQRVQIVVDQASGT